MMNDTLTAGEDFIFEPEFISLKTRTWGHVHKCAPDHYVSTIGIDILSGDETEKIGEAKAFEVRMDMILNDGESLLEVFDCYASDLHALYSELFEDDELIPSVENEVACFCNIILIKSITLQPEYRGKGLGGILALGIAELFCEQSIVALKPWPINPNSNDDPDGRWELPPLTVNQQKVVAKKLRKSYMKAGFKPLFRGSEHLYLTHFKHSTATLLIDQWNEARHRNDES